MAGHLDYVPFQPSSVSCQAFECFLPLRRKACTIESELDGCLVLDVIIAQGGEALFVLFSVFDGLFELLFLGSNIVFVACNVFFLRREFNCVSTELPLMRLESLHVSSDLLRGGSQSGLDHL